jgi:hypothetical protein
VRSVAIILFFFLSLPGCSILPFFGQQTDPFEKSHLQKFKSDYFLLNQAGEGRRILGSSDKRFVMLTFIQPRELLKKKDDLSGLAQVQKLASDPGLKDFDFEVIAIDEKENRESLNNILTRSNLSLNIFSDPTQLSAADAGATANFDSVVIHRKTKQIVGLVNMQTDQNLSGKLLSLQSEKAQPLITEHGRDPLTFASIFKTESVIDYATGIAPLLIRNCINCHREGGLAPWAMSGFDAVTSWKKMIREVLLLKRMPPAQSDNYHRMYSNETRPSSEEIRKIIRWIDQNAPIASELDPLKMWKAPAAENFRLGKPDLIIEVPEQKIAASEKEYVQVLKMQWPLDKPVRIKGMDVQTDNIKSTHHLSMYYLVPSAADPGIYTVNMFDAGYIAGYQPMFLPLNTSYLIPPLAPIRVSPHIVPTGKSEVVKMRAAFYFDNSKNPNELLSCGVDNKDIDIPPFEKKYKRSKSGIVSEDVRVIQVGTHMHSRGKSIKLTATLPDGKTEVLLSLPNYNRNWQREYILENPVLLPKGTKVTCDAIFDNSASNPRVTNPSVRVKYGWYADNEMMTCSCFAMREVDYQRTLGRVKSPYVPVPADSDRNAVTPVVE